MIKNCRVKFAGKINLLWKNVGYPRRVEGYETNIFCQKNIISLFIIELPGRLCLCTGEHHACHIHACFLILNTYANSRAFIGAHPAHPANRYNRAVHCHPVADAVGGFTSGSADQFHQRLGYDILVVKSIFGKTDG